MNPGRFYIPGGIMGRPSMVGNMARTMPLARMASSAPFVGTAGSIPRSMGVFSKVTNSIRSINWGGLLNNANKTLNVVNQTIPLVRQAGPMFNNMKSMVKIARAFGNETNIRKTFDTNKRQVIDDNINISMHDNNSRINFNDNITANIDDNFKKKEVKNDNAPNFFI